MKYQFREHIIKFIRTYNNLTAINLWFLMCTYSDKNDRIELLSQKLNEGFAVKYEDFTDYPKNANGRIRLFTNLIKNKYIPDNFGNSEYYKSSMESKNNLEKNIFKNAMIMDINLQKIFNLLSDFFCEKNNENEISQLGIKIANFRDKVEEGKKYHKSLKTIQKYWETFFQKMNKEKLKDLKNKIENFLNTPLEDIKIEANKNKQFLDEFLTEAEEGIELIDSIFFKEIYKRFNNLKEKELVRYKTSLKQFKLLEKLGENNDLNSLIDDLKKNIIKAAEKNPNLLENELEFLKKYFKFGENGKHMNFNINNILYNIQNLIGIRRNEGINNEPDNDKGLEYMDFEENPETIIQGNKNKEENVLIKEKIENLSGEILYYSRIFENNENHGLFENFFLFYDELFKLGINLAVLTQNEIVNYIIPLSNKYFYLGKNLGIIDNNQKNDDLLLLLKEFNFIIDIIEVFGKVSKKNYVNAFDVFKNIFKNSQENKLDIGDLVNIFEYLNDIKYELKNYIYIEIFLINLDIMKNNKKELLTYILDKNTKLVGDLFPILENIFFDDIDKKLNFTNIQNNPNYFQFNSDVFGEINKHINEDSLGEMIFFYFENKIMKELNARLNQNENINYLSRNLDNFRYYVEFLEKNYENKENYFLSITFAIAFVKCFIYKVIKYMQENDNNLIDSDYLFNTILKFKDKGKNLSPYNYSIQLYILKLIVYNNGNISDCRNLDLNKYKIDDLKSKLDSNTKGFAFDYMFLPIQLETDINTYKSILGKFFNDTKIFEDNNILKEINNNVDILFCLFTNFHFSYYYSKEYFKSNEYSTIKNKYLSEVKDNILKEELIQKIFDYFINLEAKKVYEVFDYFEYDQILSLLISARFIISIILSKDEKSLFYNLLVKAEETINNNQKYFNELYLKDYSNIIDKRNINCLTYTIINYLILSHFYFGFKLNLIKSDDIKSLDLFKEKGKKEDNEENEEKEISDYLLKRIFKEFNFIKKTLLPLLGINNIIIFMNSLFREIHQELIIFQIDDKDEKIKKNESSINLKVLNAINNFSNSVKEYYSNEKDNDYDNNKDNDNDELVTAGGNDNNNEIFDIISEKSKFYNNKKLINKKYPLLPYFTYTNYTSINDDFKNQYTYFYNNSSNYPLISSILSDDKIFKIIEDLPNLNKIINHIHNELNMRYTKEEIENKAIKEVFGDKLREDIQYFNNFIETNKNLFDQNKKLNDDKKLNEIINLPNSSVNYVYKEIIKMYNQFLLKMKIKKKVVNIFDEVIIQEAKEEDYNINYATNNDKKLTIKEKLEELILLYSKRMRKINNELNVYDGGKIIYNFSVIEDKLEEQFIFGKKKFSEKQREFIFSSDIFKQEANIIKEFERNYIQQKISKENKQEMKEYIENLKGRNEENVSNLFYELFLVFKYITQNKPIIKFRNEKDLIKYFELKNYKFTQLNVAINTKNILKDSLSLKSILHFYELVENEAFNNLTKGIKQKIENDKIKLDEDIIKNIDDCFEKNKIIKTDVIISAMKKYILRNININKDNYSFNLSDLKLKDLWDMTIFGTNEFNEEFKKLIDLNKEEKNVVIYLYSKIYNIEIKEEGDNNDDQNNNGNGLLD